MALKLSLKPDEKIVINGTVIANGDRRSTLIVHNKASILREKDIMQEDEATTPAKRIYFAVMLMYMQDSKIDQYHDEFALRMTEFMNVISSPEAIELCITMSREVMNNNYYKALMAGKKLVAFEAPKLS